MYNLQHFVQSAKHQKEMTVIAVVASPPSPSDEENGDPSKADREEDASNGPVTEY